MYQSGDVDYLVATDAVGMGLNLDVDHVAFASDKKFDGFRFRKLYPAELGQIAGRAGRAPARRHLRHHRAAARRSSRSWSRRWRATTSIRCASCSGATRTSTSASLARLQASLDDQPREPGLTRAPIAEDWRRSTSSRARTTSAASPASRAAVERLWEVCQVPDYRKVSPAGHADLVASSTAS